MKNPCAPTRHFVALVSCSILLACAASDARAQTLDARVSVVSLSPPRVRVEGRRAVATKDWTFRNIYAGVTGLGERLENLSLADEGGTHVPARRLAPGEFTSERPASSFSYELKLEPPAFTSDAAHVSWLTNAYGVLMPGDLLPLPATNARLQIILPTSWRLASAELPSVNTASSSSDNSYNLKDAESAVFFVGQDVRERPARRSNSSQLYFVTTGEWAFADEEAADAAAKVFEQSEKIFGGPPRGRALLVLAPFPKQTSAQNWSAETRGRTVFLLSGRWPSKVAGLAQLSVPLTHELLHLWVPNALALEGDYGWFYEGFTLYQSTRLGVRLGHLTFQDYLNALGRAFDSYNSSRRGAELSVVEASRRRWSDSASAVYSKGMLVAFLYDLTLRLRSSNRLSLEEVYRELYRRHSSAHARRDANEAVVQLLSGTGGMQDFTERHVRNPFELNLVAAVAPFGLQVESFGPRTRLLVSPRLTRAQRDLLRDLGYNG